MCEVSGRNDRRSLFKVWQKAADSSDGWSVCGLSHGRAKHPGVGQTLSSLRELKKAPKTGRVK